MRVRIRSNNGHKIVNLNRRQAIREQCHNCSGWSWKEVVNCQSNDCPLFLYRNGKGKQDAKKRAKVIRSYCLWCCGEQHQEMLKCVSKDCPLYPYRGSVLDRSVECPSIPIDAPYRANNSTSKG